MPVHRVVVRQGRDREAKRAYREFADKRVLTMLFKLKHIKNLRLFNVLLKITPVLLTIHVCVEYAPRGLILEAQ